MSNQLPKVFILDGARTPFGKFGGSLAKISPVDLATYPARKLIERNKIDLKKINHVIYANVIPSTSDTLYGARHISLKLGLPEETPGYSVNRLCGSGFQAIWEAYMMIQLGRADLVLVAGSENMSMSPHLTYGGRFGTKYGPLVTDDLLLSTLSDKHINTPMGITAETMAKQFKVTREDSDKFSYDSHQKTLKALENNLFEKEIVPFVEGKINLTKDEHVRDDINLGALSKLRPSFSTDGVVTPATASGIVDGGCATLICSEKFIKENNLKPISEVVDFHVVGVDPNIMGYGPVPAIKGLLERVKLTKDKIDLFEINEAFAPQALSCIKELELDINKVNKWGGAIAIGHPLGATGLRLINTSSYQLESYNEKYAIASACIGGGQGISVLIKSIDG